MAFFGWGFGVGVTQAQQNETTAGSGFYEHCIQAVIE